MANVLFRRGTQEYINNNVPISDGQVVFNETDQAIYVDTPVNNVITRLRYGGGNLSRSDIDSALSDTSENPVQNKVITESVLQKTDVVNDYNTAVAVTATDIPVGCGVIKTANTKIGDLQSALNTTNGTVAQHTADIASLNTGLEYKIRLESAAKYIVAGCFADANKTVYFDGGMNENSSYRIFSSKLGIGYQDVVNGVPNDIWFIYANLLPFGKGTTETDLNNIVKPCFAWIQNATNQPSGSDTNGMILQLMPSTADVNTALQFWADYNGGIYIRNKTGGAWRAWRTV